MGRFEAAQLLFGEYEKSGNHAKLKEAIEVLDEIISDRDEDEIRARNLKGRICQMRTEKMRELLKLAKPSNESIGEQFKDELDKAAAKLAFSLDKDQINELFLWLEVDCKDG